MREKIITLIVISLFSIFSFWLVYSTAGETSRSTQSVHGLFHSAYVYQVANGVIPPTNIYSIGMPASNYWGWHLLLAILMKTLNITPFESSLLVNTLTLIIFLTAFWTGTGLFIRSSLTRLVFCTVPFIILTPVELVKIALSYIRDISYIPSLSDLFPSMSLFGMAFDNRCLLLQKFLNFNGFPTGIALFTCLLVLVMKPLHYKTINALLCITGAFLTAFFHPASGMGVAVIGIAGAGTTLLSSLSRQPRDTSQLIKELVPFISIAAGLTIALPYMRSLSSAFGTGIAFHKDTYSFTLNVISYGWTLFPSMLIYGFALMRFHKLSNQGKIVLLVGILLFLGVVSIIIRDNTQYQWAILSSIPSTLLLLAIYQSYCTSSPVRKMHWYYPLVFSLIALAIIGSVNIYAVASIYHNTRFAKMDPYIYTGQAIDLKVGPREVEKRSKQKAYQWLRKHTPPDAYFLEYPRRRREIASPVIAQRRIVVSLPNRLYTQHITHQEALVNDSIEFLNSLQYCTMTRQKLRSYFAFKVPWPKILYVLIPKAQSLHNKYEHDCFSDALPWISTAYINQHFIIYGIKNPHY